MTEKEIKILSSSLEQSNDSIIVLKAIYKEGKHTVQPAFDSKKNWYAGVERLSDEQKKTKSYYVEPETIKLVLTNNYEFNMNSDVDSVNWEWVSRLPIVAGSHKDAQMTPRAMFYVFVQDREARLKVGTLTSKFKALQYVLEDSPSNLANRALIMGQDFGTESPEAIKEWLAIQADKNPEQIIRLYEAKNTGLNILFLKALQMGIITVSSEGVYKFDDKLLGLNEEGALGYLLSKDATEIVELLKRRVHPDYSDKEKETLAETGAEPTSTVDLLTSSKED